MTIVWYYFSLSLFNIDAVNLYQACHLFAVEEINNSIYLCAAQPQKIVILKYNYEKNNFMIKKVSFQVFEMNTIFTFIVSSQIYAPFEFVCYITSSETEFSREQSTMR